MTALDQNHLVSRNCRDGYRTGPVPALLIAALASALIFTFSGQAQSASFEPIDRFIVQPRAGLADADLDHELKAANAHRLRRLNKQNLQLVEMTGPVLSASVLKKLKSSKLFKFVEQDARVAVADTVVTDPYYSSSWHLPDINAPQAWDYENGTGVVIAILDTGVDATHPDLASNIVPGWNIYDDNPDTSDVYGHGTLVAGTASAAANDGIGSAGIAWGAKIMPVRIADANGYAYFSTVAQGIYWAADHGARVANISFNGVAGSTTVQAAADYLRAKGGVVVVAAGNSGVQEAYAPSSSLLAVSATDKNNVAASFTSTGDYVDLAAPGVGIFTTKNGGGYGNASGTSFSSPLVAGTAALAISANPGLTAAQVDNLLLSTTTDLGTPGYDSTFGYGLLNAGAVVYAALSLPPIPPVDVQAPTVAIAAPTGGAVSGLVSVNVNASDNVGVTQVDLYVNGTKVASDTAAPFAFSWDSKTVGNGSVSLTAYASDAAGNTTASTPVVVTVNNVVPDTTAPTVAIAAPTGGTVSGTVAVNVNASDNVGVTQVDLYVNGTKIASDTTAPFAFSWDSKTIANGSASLTAYAYDAAGNFKASSPVAVTVNNVVPDTTAPTVAIAVPTGGTVSGTVAVNVNASDNVGVTQVDLYVNGTKIASDTTAPFAFSWDSKTVANGSASLTAYAYDAAGNFKASSPVVVTVNNAAATGDSQPPVVTLTGLVDGQKPLGTFRLVVSATDNVKVSSVSLAIDGVVISTASGSSLIYTWKTIGYSDGVHTMTASATDSSGNQASMTITFLVGNVTSDTTAPTVAIAAPTGGTVSGTVAVNVNASDNVGVTQVDLYVNGTKIASDTTAPFAFSWDSKTVANGSASLTAYAYDAAGNFKASSPVVVTVNNVVPDTTAPTVAIAVPTGGTVSGTVAVNVNASDNVGVTQVDLYVNGTKIASDTTAPFAFSWDSKTVANGSASLTAYAYDAAGNFKASSPVAVTVNNVVPDTTAPTVAIAVPTGGTVSGTVAVNVNASDNVGVTQVDLYVNGTKVASDTTAPFAFSWDSKTVANGSASLTAYAYDAAGNFKASSPVVVTVNNVVPDTTAPTVAIAVPTGGTVSGTVSVNVNASDNVGVTQVDLYVNGTKVASDTTAPFAFSWDSKTVANGSASLTAYAYDAAGNFKASSPVVVTVNNAAATGDSQPPVVTLTGLVDGQKPLGTFRLVVSATDNVKVSSVSLAIDGVIKATANSSSLTYSWKTIGYSAGAHTMTASATDSSGNQANVTITFYQ